MVGLQTLNLSMGVRIPPPQPIDFSTLEIAICRFFILVSSGSDALNFASSSEQDTLVTMRCFFVCKGKPS